MYRQAYLIIAHKNKQFDEEDCRKLIKKSGIYFTKRTSVTWGGYSLINVELMLLKLAAKKEYNYYHLLSGQDLPIQFGKTIQEFFIEHQGEEVVGRNRRTFLGRIAAASTLLQKCIHLKRNKSVRFQKGPQWFSITDDFAKYIIQQENWIKGVFSNTVCCDEVFLQTVAINSPFKDKIYQQEIFSDTEKSVMRLVDWKRGGPYIFLDEDYQELIDSKMLFARKFDCDKDATIVRKIFELYG